MDQNELSDIGISSQSNRYYLFMKKTFKFLVPVSLVSFLLSYVTGFSFFFAYNFHFSALVFPLFARALERKYMFLICNGILAFLGKTFKFYSSSLSVPDFNDHDESTRKPVSESTLFAGQEDEIHACPDKTEVNAAEEKLKLQENGNEHVRVSFTSEIDQGTQAGGLMIDNEDLDLIEEEEEEVPLDEEDMEEGGGLLCASASEEEVGVNINTEELNRKFEEFIRKMKEEIRIQAQQPQLVTV
nr:uncharacterized protein LOC113710597 [Coffea arabica]